MNGEKGRQMLETIKGREAQRRKGDEGFTLIELLVVIVILAILAAIVVFAVGGIGDKGQASACDTDLKTIQTAQEAFFANVRGAPAGRYAADLQELKDNNYLTNDAAANALHTTAGNATGYTITPNGGTCTNNYATGTPPAAN